MFKKFTNGCVVLVQRYLPDPFLFAVILTLIVFVLAMIFTSQGPMTMVIHWSNGFWKLLEFSMQMALVLVTGHALANAPIIKKGLKSLSSLAKSPMQAIVLVTIISTIACWINWGFGLVIGALFARQIAKQVKGVDYRLLIASAYSGFLVWHAGLSGSIPLKLATPGTDLATVTNGVVTDPISTNNTIFATFNIIIVLAIFVVLPIINRAMHPSAENVVTIDRELLAEEEEAAYISENMTPADKMENSPILSMLIGIMGLTFIIYYFKKNGFKLNLNIINFIFLFTGIILHGTPRRFLNAVKNAAKGTAGIILQFPFYAGIMGMMTGTNEAGLSLAGVMSNWFVNISNQTTFPFFTFLSAGLVNFFVPSGGGQWAVQAPIMIPAGAKLGVPVAKTAMAIAWGDAWTNMIQPFWALPALGIAGLGARDIMGFCVVDLLITGAIIALGLMLL
ncbi:short-chain fatty acid transporter [Caloranaerobacter azorensis H53214]|uniref:Short-chain fatty acid transporter n=1 Tax=Caloranaerobacter azorensis H53214 TaxID=1156417 RepID=A0A096BEH3_9FIRM|nr:TIGR00366 family protein [Caloranaerobacter azorensis]KGG79525.1 short-chain fatty acid transporter [Caloranaerobacter azorensis H53214]